MFGLEVTDMLISETWSISDERIRAFFLAQNDITEKENDIFSYRQCEIRLTPLPLRKVGRFGFPQSLVEFEGPDPDTAEIHRRFVLQFISAGG